MNGDEESGVKSVRITFDPKGGAHCLHTEVICLQSLGRLSVRRATSVEFIESLQVWEVRDLDGHSMFRSSSRQQCLNWEQVHFNR